MGTCTCEPHNAQSRMIGVKNIATFQQNFNLQSLSLASMLQYSVAASVALDDMCGRTARPFYRDIELLNLKELLSLTNSDLQKKLKLSILKNYKAQPRLNSLKGALSYGTLGYRHNDYDFTSLLGSLVSI
jgi:hypothetical protein